MGRDRKTGRSKAVEVKLLPDVEQWLISMRTLFGLLDNACKGQCNDELARLRHAIDAVDRAVFD
jgi:hypothetical protein